MIDRATEFAQKFTGGLSRRNFLGRVGGAAAIAAAACAGLLLIPNSRQSELLAVKKKPPKKNNICVSNTDCPDGYVCFHGHCHRVRVKKK